MNLVLLCFHGLTLYHEGQESGDKKRKGEEREEYLNFNSLFNSAPEGQRSWWRFQHQEGRFFFPPTLPTSKSQKEHGFPNVLGESRECGCTEKKDFSCPVCFPYSRVGRSKETKWRAQLELETSQEKAPAEALEMALVYNRTRSITARMLTWILSCKCLLTDSYLLG